MLTRCPIGTKLRFLSDERSSSTVRIAEAHDSLNVIFDWAGWKRGEEQLANPGLIAHATVRDCLKLIALLQSKAQILGRFP